MTDIQLKRFAWVLPYIAVASMYAQSVTKPFSVLSPIVTIFNPATVSDFVVGDFNADGKVDIVTLSYARDSTGQPALPVATALNIFLGNGDGSFRKPTPIATFSTTGGYVGAGDFNGDGKLDLAVMTGNAVLVYLGKGDGMFSVGPPYGTQLTASQKIFVADLNGDGIKDLVASGPLNTGVSAVLFGNGDGTFHSPVLLTEIAITIADVNRDGFPDIIGASFGGGPLNVLLNRGDGTFLQGQTVGAIPYLSGAPVAGRNFYQSIVSGDFNGDGNIDIIVSQPAGGGVGMAVPANLAILLGNGDGTFQAPKIFTGNGNSTLAIDLNQDGKLDLVSNYSVQLGNGDGTFGPPFYLSVPSYLCQTGEDIGFLPTNCGTYQVTSAAADVNGDGVTDLITLGDQPPPTYFFSTATLISAYVNNSPGDGFLSTGVSSTGGTGLTTIPATVSTNAVIIPRGPGFALGQNSLATAYGVNLAPSTESAAGPPFPTTLGGIRLHLGDSLVQLLYVSPTQINYLSPPGPFLATVSVVFANPAIAIERVGSPFVPKGFALPMVPNAPGLFSVDSSGVAAATAVRVASDGTQTPVAVFDCSASPCKAVPIDLSGGPVYLSLYGTGFDFNSSEGFVETVTCGGGQTVYAGPQGAVPGLNQINLLLSVAPSGTRSISCELKLTQRNNPYYIDVSSNPVQILIK